MDLIELLTEPFFCDSLPNIEMTISQYDYWDCEIGRYTGTFTAIFDSILDFNKYYYRVTSLGKHDLQRRVSTEHFGIRATSIGSFKVSEESFINSYLNHCIKEYAKQKEFGHTLTAIPNFAYILIHDFWFIDRMKTIKQNTSNGFHSALDNFLNKFKEFQQIDNLNDIKGKNGIYLLVLDEYNICYLGQANDLKKRIMRHWSRNDYFTGTGIDMFKAKDTTRIYIALTDDRRKTNMLEHRAISQMPSRYSLNSIAGGNIDYLSENAFMISKSPCPDSDYVDYVVQSYNLSERISANKDRFKISK